MSANDSNHPTINEDIDVSQVSEEEDDGTGVDESSGKRSRASEIWNYFEKIERGSGTDSQLAMCAVPKCKSKPYSCGKSATTKSLWRHLQNAHWNIYINTEEYQRRKKGKTAGGSLEQYWKVLYDSVLPLIM
jgi:hypothetical protein